jgi:hypothetical protein
MYFRLMCQRCTLVRSFVQYASTHKLDDNDIALIAVIAMFRKVYGCD